MENLIDLLTEFRNRIVSVELFFFNKERVSSMKELRVKLPNSGITNINGIGVKFKFHGAGVTFRMDDGLILSYDFVSEMDSSINFSPWKFVQFLNTYQSEITYTEEKILPFLEKQSKLNTLQKHPQGYYQYGLA